MGCPCASIISPAWYALRISSDVPTAMNSPLRMAKASAVLNDESTVYTTALYTIRSACPGPPQADAKTEPITVAKVMIVLFMINSSLIVLFCMNHAVCTLHVLMKFDDFQPFFLK